jgi:predicted GIY-YIG superfamily endonuclease
MTVYVYKITRTDGLEYIGITINLNKRINEHLKTSRFDSGILKFEVLDQTEDYQHALKLEEEYITKFNTYENGLNLTPNGGKLGDDGKFNTFGMKFSEDTKDKMCRNHWSKTGSYNQSGRKLAEQTKSKIRDKQIGRCHAKDQRKITEEQARDIVDAYNHDTLKFTSDYVRRFVTTSQKPIVETLNFSELKSQNGKFITREKLYAEYFAELFNVSTNTIRAILNGKNTRSIKI